MAKVKFYKINNSQLSSLPIVEGQLVFVQDTGSLYIDKDNSNRVQIDGINYTNGDGISISGKTISVNADSSLSTSSENPVQNKIITTALNDKIEASDITITPVQASGATVGTIQIGSGSAVTLYAPQPGNVTTELVQPRTTYYLTGVTDTTATEGSQIYNTRLSNTFTGLKYETSTSAQGGTLTVDDREVTLGLYYTIA